MSDSTNRTCLITGALGVLGRHLAQGLKERFPLKLTDIRNGELEGMPCTGCDLTDLNQTFETFQGADTVIHMAIASGRNHGPPGEADLPEAERSQEWVDAYSQAMLTINPTSTYNVFETARRLGIRRVVYISSLTVYLGKRDTSPRGPETPLEPANLYACTKLFGEHIARLYWLKHGIDALTLRIGQPYPTGTYLDDACKTSSLARSVYVYVPDFIQAVTCALETPVDYGVFNIVSLSDSPCYDLTPAKSIGYQPIGYFSEEGVTVRHP